MSRKRINKKIFERSLLTEVMPYETPIVFSNWGSYNYYRTLTQKNIPPLLKNLFDQSGISIPYKYSIKKKSESVRTLSLIHPKNSSLVVDLYQRFELQIIKKNRKSSFSIRYPSEIATSFKMKDEEDDDLKYLEKLKPGDVYGSTYFTYRLYPYLYKFFDSDQFTELEKAFSKIQYLDISNCFSSIYTHSISWAIRSKKVSKDNLFSSKKGFDNTLDNLMQSMNYQETNGIPIGPEISRIFAELILQEIDNKVEVKLEENHIIHGVDYWCCRYIDDYYIFFNSDRIRRLVVEILAHELEAYKLYLNHGKAKIFERPFITEVSIAKIELSTYINSMVEDFKSGRRINAYKELNKIRALISLKDVEVSALASFFITALNNKIFEFKDKDPERRVNYYLLLMEMAFHIFRMDIRVNNTYKIINLVLEIITQTSSLKKNIRGKVFDKIYFEFLNAIEFSIKEGGVIECMNLIILLSELDDENYFIPQKTIDSLLEKCRSEHKDEYSYKRRLGYFEICSFIYYFKNNSIYESQKVKVLIEAQEILCTFDPMKYAESAYLLIDLVACPFIDNQVKKCLIQSAIFHSKKTIPSDSEIGWFRNFINKEIWYFNWNQNEELKKLTEMKKLHLSY